MVLVYIVTRFAPQIRDFISNADELSLTAGGVEAAVRRQVELAAALGMAEVKRTGGSEEVMVNASSIAALVKERVTPQSVLRLSHAKVLWVDDNPEDNYFARQPLETLGVRFVLSRSTGEALQAIEQQAFDAIISDMERESDVQAGIALLDSLRNRDNRTPYIIYCGQSSAKRHRAEAFRKGAQGITSNSYEMFDLLSRVLGAEKEEAA